MRSPRPPSDLIEYNKLLHAIARYLYPDPVDLPDLPGVVGKRFIDRKTKIWWSTTDLTAGDQACLRELVIKHAGALPPLRTMMRRRDRLTFRRAFRKFDDRPGWEPVLRTEWDIEQIRSSRGEARLLHDAALKRQIAQGSIRHFDSDRIPAVPHFERITYVPWDDAQAYLAPLSLDLALLFTSFTEIGNPAGSALPRSLRSPADASNPSPPGMQRRGQWSAEDRLQIIESAQSGQPEVAARKFGITSQYVKQLATRFEKEAAARSPSLPNLPSEQTADSTNGIQSSYAVATSMPASQSLVRVQPARDRHLPNVPQPTDRADHSKNARSATSGAPKVILRMPEVERRIGLKRSSVYERLSPRSKYYDGSFPRPVSLTGRPLSMNDRRRNGGAVGFVEDEIERWIATRLTR